MTVAGSALSVAGCALPWLQHASAQPPTPPGSRAGLLRVAAPTNADQTVQPIWQAIIERAGADGNPPLQAIPLPYAPSTPTAAGTPTYDLGLGLSQALAAATPDRPDILATNGITVAPLLEAGLIVPLDAALAADRQFQPDAYLPGALDLGRLHGRQAALPIGVQPCALAYAPGAFTAAGLPLPSTGWDRPHLVEVARQLTRTTGQGEPTQWGFGPSVWACWQYLLADGIVPVTTEGRSPGLGSPAAAQSLHALADLWAVQHVAWPPGAASPQAAMTIAQPQLGLGATLNNLLPWRFAEPPRGKQQATRLDALAAVAMTPTTADRAATVTALRKIQDQGDRFAVLPARFRAETSLPETYPVATPSVFRAPTDTELTALRAMARYGQGIRGDLVLAANPALFAFLSGRSTVDQTVQQLGQAAAGVLSADA